MSTPCLIGGRDLRVSQSPHRQELFQIMEIKEGNVAYLCLGKAEEPVPSSVNVVHRYK